MISLTESIYLGVIISINSTQPTQDHPRISRLHVPVSDLGTVDVDIFQHLAKPGKMSYTVLQ